MTSSVVFAHLNLVAMTQLTHDKSSISLFEPFAQIYALEFSFALNTDMDVFKVILQEVHIIADENSQFISIFICDNEW